MSDNYDRQMVAIIVKETASRPAQTREAMTEE